MYAAAQDEEITHRGKAGYVFTINTAKELGLNSNVPAESVFKYCSVTSTCALVAVWKLSKINTKSDSDSDSDSDFQLLQCIINNKYWSGKSCKPARIKP